MSENNWKNYRRTNIAEMRPYILGEDLSGVSVSGVGTPEAGGMIARNPENHADQWYVAKAYFEKNFEETMCMSEQERYKYKQDRAGFGFFDHDKFMPPVQVEATLNAQAAEIAKLRGVVSKRLSNVEANAKLVTGLVTGLNDGLRERLERAEGLLRQLKPGVHEIEMCLDDGSDAEEAIDAFLAGREGAEENSQRRRRHEA